jgi:hypothetical protein
MSVNIFEPVATEILQKLTCSQMFYKKGGELFFNTN